MTVFANSYHQLAFTNALLYLTTIYLSKIAATLLFMRLTPDEKHIKVCHGVLLVSTLWVIASILAMALRCDLSEPWIDATDAQCTGMVCLLNIRPLEHAPDILWSSFSVGRLSLPVTLLRK